MNIDIPGFADLLKIKVRILGMKCLVTATGLEPRTT